MNLSLVLVLVLELVVVLVAGMCGVEPGPGVHIPWAGPPRVLGPLPRPAPLPLDRRTALHPSPALIQIQLQTHGKRLKKNKKK